MSEKVCVVENKMGTMAVVKLIFNMSFPMMASMLVMAMYNIVDSIFVAKIGEEAITAISLAFPVQNLMLSFSVGTSLGVNALLSNRLGQKKQNEVNKIAMNGVFLAVCNSILFVVLQFVAIRPYFESQVKNDLITAYGIDYMKIIMLFSLGMSLGIMMDKLLQATGRTFLSMVSQIAGAIFNIVFDPILIFGIGPFPEMGIKGAALATVLGQFLGLLVSIWLNFNKNKDIQFYLKNFIPKAKLILEIYRVGIPSILLNSISTVAIYFLNKILGLFSTTAIAVYGLYIKLNSFVFMPVFGLNGGVIPIIAYNYGAENKSRIISAIKHTILFSSIITFVGILIFEFFPEKLLSIFDASAEMIYIGIPALRIIAISFVGAGIAIPLSAIFQALGNAGYSMIISFARQLVVLMPVVYLLSRTGELSSVWWAFPIAEIISVVLSLLFLLIIFTKKIKPIRNGTL